jgi:hypothetical protein
VDVAVATAAATVADEAAAGTAAETDAVAADTETGTGRISSTRIFRFFCFDSLSFSFQ